MGLGLPTIHCYSPFHERLARDADLFDIAGIIIGCLRLKTMNNAGMIVTTTVEGSADFGTLAA
jgi:hypothetical protein